MDDLNIDVASPGPFDPRASTGGSIVDTDGSLAIRFGVTTFPAAVLIDRQGRIAGEVSGDAATSRLDDVVNALRAEESPTASEAQVTPLGLSNLGVPLPVDAVPDAVRSPSNCEIDPRRVWLIADAGEDARLYVAQGPRVSYAVAGTGRLGGQFGIGCSPGPPMRESPFPPGSKPRIETVVFDQASKTIAVASAVVPDGWTEAKVGGRSIRIDRNGLILIGPLARTARVEFTGPAGRTVIPLAGDTSP